MQKKLPTFLIFLSFLLALALSIKSLREPDIWWQIRTGEWILAHHQVPVTDLFSYTHQGQPWINIKWGFEVLAALITKLAGPEAVFILQMLVSVLILFFIKKILQLFKLDTPALFFVTALLLLFGIEYRIIGRPEMFSHLFVVIYLYLLLLYKKSGTKLIYLLIPLQIIWCNMHEAYAIGIVMLVIFTAVSWAESVFLKRKKPFELSFITIASTLAIIINPRGLTLLTRPFNIFGQVQQNKYTTELDSFFTAEYWHKESYLFVLMALLFIVFSVKWIRSAEFKNGSTLFPPAYLATCLAFLFLSFTAYRNIIFFTLTVTPLLAFYLQHLLTKSEKWHWMFAASGLVIYALIVSNKYYELSGSRDRFGLEVMSTNNPSGAAAFIEQKNLRTKKCFSDYLTSSFLLWKLQPDFKTFIDLRDLDIFSTGFFEKYLEIINKPDAFHTLDQQENFDYVVLYRRSNEALHHYLYNDSVYACTFVDAVAAVYQKTDDIPSGDIFQTCKPIESSAVSNAINVIFNPAYKPFDYENLNMDFEAAMYYTTVGKISLAEKRIYQFLAVYPDNTEAMALRSQIMNLKSQIRPGG